MRTFFFFFQYKIIQGEAVSKDLKTNACVTPAKPVPKFIREALNEVHEEVSSRYYGCGLVVPECLENCSILDLGSGSGRDCYMLSKLVGEKGSITGIDMTEEQVWGVKYIDYHTKKFGYQRPNVEFSQGYIENLNAANLNDNYYDIIISNCVINLSPDKRTLLSEAHRVLKDGGEMYFSDVYANHAITEDLKKNKVLWGECISGALYWKELFQIAEEIGFSSPRLVSSSFITVDNKELEELLGDYKFVSATFRLFKVPKNKVQEKSLVIYDGGITGFKDEIQFDVNFTFKVQNARASCELCGDGTGSFMGCAHRSFTRLKRISPYGDISGPFGYSEISKYGACLMAVKSPIEKQWLIHSETPNSREMSVKCPAVWWFHSTGLFWRIP
uniref:Arsenite methyltransferase n=1 Tax=Leptobrachium leishanense TaxID=445787 RepID=A0A8C5R1E9_9ANUR